MNKTEENKVLLAEVKKTLDDQVHSLDFPTRSRLTQARFHAIDHGSLSNRTSFTGGRKLVYQSIALVSIVAATLTLLINVQTSLSPADEGAISSSPPIDAGEMETVNSNEDTLEDIEIYNWLYEHYG